MKRGFTLTELVVVIGVTAVLLGVLLPALHAARESAREVACAANMRTAAQGMLMYTLDNQDWLAGPHTSGSIWKPSLDAIGPGETSHPSTPLQNMDWASPTLHYLLELPERDIDRLKQFYQSDLACPSNHVNFNYLEFNNEGAVLDPASLRYLSYAAVLTFHAWPSREESGLLPAVWRQTMDIGSPLPGYAPRLGRVGSPSTKGCLIEGGRFVSGPMVSLNLARYQILGGNFMANGPFHPSSDTPHWQEREGFKFTGRITAFQRQYAWRHRGRMNVAFFDGHVESMTPRDTLRPELWLPKGVRVTENSWLLDRIPSPLVVGGMEIDS